MDLIATSNDGWSALSYACKAGHTQIVKFLVRILNEKLGNDKMLKILNKPDKNGKTSFFKAACAGHGEIVSHLLTLEGCDFRSANYNDGWTPLHVSAIFDKLEVVKILLENPHFLKDEKKEYLEMEDKNGRKAIRLARDRCHSEIVEVIYIILCTPLYYGMPFGLSARKKKHK